MSCYKCKKIMCCCRKPTQIAVAQSPRHVDEMSGERAQEKKIGQAEALAEQRNRDCSTTPPRAMLSYSPTPPLPDRQTTPPLPISASAAHTAAKTPNLLQQPHCTEHRQGAAHQQKHLEVEEEEARRATPHLDRSGAHRIGAFGDNGFRVGGECEAADEGLRDEHVGEGIVLVHSLGKMLGVDTSKASAEVRASAHVKATCLKTTDCTRQGVGDAGSAELVGCQGGADEEDSRVDTPILPQRATARRMQGLEREDTQATQLAGPDETMEHSTVRYHDGGGAERAEGVGESGSDGGLGGSSPLPAFCEELGNLLEMGRTDAGLEDGTERIDSAFGARDRTWEPTELLLSTASCRGNVDTILGSSFAASEGSHPHRNGGKEADNDCADGATDRASRCEACAGKHRAHTCARQPQDRPKRSCRKSFKLSSRFGGAFDVARGGDKYGLEAESDAHGLQWWLSPQNCPWTRRLSFQDEGDEYNDRGESGLVPLLIVCLATPDGRIVQVPATRRNFFSTLLDPLVTDYPESVLVAVFRCASSMCRVHVLARAGTGRGCAKCVGCRNVLHKTN